ncbi:hypothetical protein F4X33_04375, partial [Candidatus Poribacteria bacterium]|nr:hypothetical protein [Candidatus Poribacteria bacterium]
MSQLDYCTPSSNDPQRKLNPTGQKIIDAIEQIGGRWDRPFSDLAADCGLSEKGLKKGLRWLEQNDFLTIKTRPGRPSILTLAGVRE